MSQKAFAAQIEAVLNRSQPLDQAIAAMQSTRPVYAAVRTYAHCLAVAPQGHPSGTSSSRATVNLKWVAAAGTSLTVHAWESLANATSDCFDDMAAAQQSDGAWLSTTAADSIELRGYDELVLLHAITSFAMRTSRRDLRPAIAANAEFHLRELQPDHATTEPWALHAVAMLPSTQPLAEQLLHAAVTQQPQGLHGLPVVLLADALYGLRSTDFFTE